MVRLSFGFDRKRQANWQMKGQSPNGGFLFHLGSMSFLLHLYLTAFIRKKLSAIWRQTVLIIVRTNQKCQIISLQNGAGSQWTRYKGNSPLYFNKYSYDQIHMFLTSASFVGVAWQGWAAPKVGLRMTPASYHVAGSSLPASGFLGRSALTTRTLWTRTARGRPSGWRRGYYFRFGQHCSTFVRFERNTAYNPFSPYKHRKSS